MKGCAELAPFVSLDWRSTLRCLPFVLVGAYQLCDTLPSTAVGPPSPSHTDCWKNDLTWRKTEFWFGTRNARALPISDLAVHDHGDSGEQFGTTLYKNAFTPCTCMQRRGACAHTENIHSCTDGQRLTRAYACTRARVRTHTMCAAARVANVFGVCVAAITHLSPVPTTNRHGVQACDVFHRFQCAFSRPHAQQPGSDVLPDLRGLWRICPGWRVLAWYVTRTLLQSTWEQRYEAVLRCAVVRGFSVAVVVTND